MNQELLEWLGYAASILVAISLLMSSIVKLRIYNLVGSALFAVYGFAIGAFPVGLINTFIIFINIYYLFKILSEKEYFKIIEVGKDDQYLKAFLEFYREDIKSFSSPKDPFLFTEDTFGFYILRNLVPAGIFIATKEDSETLVINVDFAVPAYRDFKIGKYIFNDYQNYFINLGFKKFHSYSSNPKHINYLKRMGFQEEILNGEKVMTKII
ncbi:YgjV family protein [Alkaliphilus transvaalensis]|uniref:YgjV family protein n=1 Tax=Alkaliphilus transvaalensis TaxID=114628 RepID=UPI00047C1B39|nr:YgjV family protein [Alkaliphilus transvaalensis]